jgi:hypothetical protein
LIYTFAATQQQDWFLSAKKPKAHDFHRQYAYCDAESPVCGQRKLGAPEHKISKIGKDVDGLRNDVAAKNI